MRKKLIYCELCGSDTLTATHDFVVFHCLSFCSPDCRDDYRSADEALRAQAEKPRRAAPRKAA